MITLDLPLPPSSNNAYPGSSANRRRHLGSRHEAWRTDAGWLIKQANPGRIEGPFRFAIYLPLEMAGDCSNRIKIAEDLLVSLGVTDDDRHAVSVHAERSADVAPGRCRIVVEAAHEPAEATA